MKKITKLLFGLTFLFSLAACNGGIENRKTLDFKVWGNCGMCKKTIEKSLDKEGIEANWDKNTKQIKVQYDSVKYTEDQIHSMIADAGYDTEKKRGNDVAYSKLHKCCKYERKKE